MTMPIDDTGYPVPEQPVTQHPHPVLEKLTSRKLILSVFTIMGLVGLWLGTAVIEPTLLETAATEIKVFAALIAGIGGSGAYLQYVIDKNGQ